MQINAPPRVQIVAPPRVHFDIEANQGLQFNADTAPQLIVESLTVSKQNQQPQIKSILKQAPDSIANRVKGQQSTQLSSIAEHIAQQQRESINPVLDHKKRKTT